MHVKSIHTSHAEVIAALLSFAVLCIFAPRMEGGGPLHPRVTLPSYYVGEASGWPLLHLNPVGVLSPAQPLPEGWSLSGSSALGTATQAGGGERV